MNNEVKPPEESDLPKMHLVVLEGGSNNHIESPYHYDPSPGAPSAISIAFVNPYPTSEFNDDLQFVIEVEGPTEDSRAAEFPDGGCDNNKRISGRLLGSQESVLLKINDPTARLRVWAGWATGHNAVRLVPDLVLEPGTAAETKEAELPSSPGDNKGKDDEEATDQKLQRKRNKNTLESPGDRIPEGLKNIGKVKNLQLEVMRDSVKRDKEQPAFVNAMKQKIRDQHIDLAEGTRDDDNENQRQRMKKRHKLSDHTGRRDHRDIPEVVVYDDGGTDDDLPPVEPEAVNDDVLPDEGDLDDDTNNNAAAAAAATANARRKARAKSTSEHIEYPYDASRHLLACGFFAITMGLFLTVVRRKRDKGRRDL